MKITLIKSNKQQNKQTVKLQTAEECVKDLREGKYADEVRNLHDFLYNADEYMHFKNMHRLPMVCPSAEMRQNSDGLLEMVRFNGLLTLSVAGLHDKEEAERLKQMAAILPSTCLACIGSSGKTLKIVVAISNADGIMPRTEAEAERLCRQAAPLVTSLYETLLKMTPASSLTGIGPAFGRLDGSLLHTGFRMTSDAEAFFRQEATPLCIPGAFTIADSRQESPAVYSSVADESIGQQTRELIALLEKNYVFRMNKVMGYVEYRSKEKWHYGWQPVDERMQNSMAMEARLAGLNVWDKDINRFLKSNRVQLYDPIDEFLWNLHGKWDGKDHIGQLAKTVPTANRHWPRWFRIWFLGMVAQWMGKNRQYGNSIAPLLISRQGYNKSTFCKSLLPDELQWGYNDNLLLSEKKAVLQAMSQFLLINLDEFNQISPKVQEGFLKNLIQLASVKVKRPYGKHVEEFPRLASFIATANVTDILADPSGNRRFIGIELTGPIDVSRRINHEQLYAQAVALLEKGEPYWLDEEQTRMVMGSNRQFQLRSPEEMFFSECFVPADSEDDGQWLTTTVIFDRIRRKAGAALKGGNIQKFGRVLSNIDTLANRRTKRGTEYLVKALE